MNIHDGCGIGMRLRMRLRTAPHDGCGAHRKLSGIRPHVGQRSLRFNKFLDGLIFKKVWYT